MHKRCEVCLSFRPGSELVRASELLELAFGERRVLLCRGHAGIARNSEVSSLAELRALYGESEGKRSYISRRASRVAAGNGSPRSAGRRAGDLL